MHGKHTAASFKDTGNRALSLEFEVDTIDVDKISRIDLTSQRFEGQLLLGLRIAGGALDPNMCRKEKTVITDDEGNLKASAGWYASKFETANASSYEMTDINIVEKGNDLFVWLKIHGEYCEPMELENYPFDIQALTLALTLTKDF